MIYEYYWKYYYNDMEMLFMMARRDFYLNIVGSWVSTVLDPFKWYSINIGEIHVEFAMQL